MNCNGNMGISFVWKHTPIENIEKILSSFKIPITLIEDNERFLDVSVKKSDSYLGIDDDIMEHIKRRNK